MELPVSMAVFAAIGIACLGLGAAAFLAVRAERMACGRTAPTEQELYERGEEAARKREDARSARASSPFAKRLHAAGIEGRPLLWAVAAAVAVAASFAVATAVCGSIVAGILAAAAAVVAMRAVLEGRTRKRRDLFDAQLARVLPRVSAGMRGSLTLERALRVATAHADDPLKEEFSRVLADAAYGMPLYRALEGMAERTQHADARTLAAAARIGQRRGGGIASALDMIASRVNARLRESRELRTEVASAKMAKWFVAAAMPAIFLIMYASNAEFARFYAGEPLGWCVLGVAALAEVLGLLAARRITSLKR